ncbi:methyltransferase domain-containing protein [Pontibacterium sp. N1Y112]|uniref:Methyltransferase domain-containing protein n=1 Tax=Pontibacterium sinense TaxID=2781979 RepID=A0A8J7K026_9GAMM|nr:methyltransferase domain-containing protein [Pontibacterium sinense]MBE9398474.1 methyltransferase domain-containing protein [Pontibacterium sinense]
MPALVTDHYEQKLDADTIIRQLQEAYPNGPNQFQLAPVDQLHIGGIKASLKLIERIGELKPNSVLDIGSGLGGLMRLVGDKLDLQIIGLDITHPLNHINQRLSALNDANPIPALITGDAHHLPFPDNQFDLIVFQHSLLNMPDATLVLSECKRILSAEGSILLHEVLEGPNHSNIKYPVPWARSADSSHLRSQQELESLIQSAGFKIDTFSDWSQEALSWRKRQSEKEQQAKDSGQATQPPVSPALILGPEFGQMGANVMRNLGSEAARVVEVLARSIG